MTYANRDIRGFTVLELSTVIVIMGLLIGGVVVAQNMIRASQLRAAVSEAQRYTQALQDFMDKYLLLPGDFNGATTLWGAADADTTLCKTTIGTTPTATCNGDGNGRIGQQNNATTYFENYRAWQHLANAQMIEAKVTGIAVGTNERVVGQNIPASRLDGAGWGVTCMIVNDIVTKAVYDIPFIIGDAPANHVLWLGGNTAAGHTNNKQAGVMKTAEALSIDQKIDDGLPSTGKVLAQINSSSPYCSTGGGTYNAVGTYDLTQTSNVCALVFKTGL